MRGRAVQEWVWKQSIIDRFQLVQGRFDRFDALESIETSDLILIRSISTHRGVFASIKRPIDPTSYQPIDPIDPCVQAGTRPSRQHTSTKTSKQRLNPKKMATDLAKGEENVGVPIHGPSVKGELMKAAAWYGARDIRGPYVRCD